MPVATKAIASLNNLLFHQGIVEEEEEEAAEFKRLALFFTQGLHQRIVINSPNRYEVLGELKCNNSSILAFQMLQEHSPYLKFAHLTANQAILDATQGDDDQDIHVIDFDNHGGYSMASTHG